MAGLDGKVAIVTGGGSGLGEAIGKALARRGVKVVLSDIKLQGAQLVARHPLGRLGRPDEVAPLVCFLLSNDASFITGPTTW